MAENEPLLEHGSALVKCAQCGHVSLSTVTRCSDCGADLTTGTRADHTPETLPVSQIESDKSTAPATSGDSPVIVNTDTEPPSTIPIKPKPLFVCSNCGHLCQPGDATCPKCGLEVHCPGSDVLSAMSDEMITRPVEPQSIETFEPGTNAILQLTLSGGWLSLCVDEPMILGRGPSVTGEKTLDLTDFGGYELGMSRRHVILRRSNNRLKIADLGSANGTFLNGKQLIPHVDYVARHGDELLLGRMPITILFSVIKLSDD